MPERTFTFTVEIAVHAKNEETARFKLGNATSSLEHVRIVDVREGEERTWDDDVRDAEEDGREVFHGYGLTAHVDTRRVPGALRRDLRLEGER